MERLTVSMYGCVFYNDDETGLKLEPCEIDPHRVRLLLEALEKYEDTGLTPQEVQALKERDTAKSAIITGYNRAIGCKVGECPKCGMLARDYMNFCNDCGQRLEWED